MNTTRAMAVRVMVLAALALAGAGYAATYVWSGNAVSPGGGYGGVFGLGTDWADAGNWVDGAGAPVADYPDDLSDVALINRSGTPYFLNDSAAGDGPTVMTPAGAALTVGSIRAGVWFQSNAQVILQNDLNVNVFAHELVGTNTSTFNAHTVTMTGTAAEFRQTLAAGGYVNIGNAVMQFQGSGTFSPGYIGTNWGDVFLGDTADDEITVTGAGNNALLGGRLVFGPGTVHMDGRLHQRRAAGLAYELDPAATVDGPFAVNYGVQIDAAASLTLPPGVYGARLEVQPYTGAPTHTLTGSTTLGELYIDFQGSGSVTVDVTAANHPLTVQNTLHIQDGVLNLRDAPLSVGNVLLDDPDARLLAGNAAITVSGNWDTATAGAASVVDLDTASLTFTGTGTIAFYAPSALDNQPVLDLEFLTGAAYTLQSDIYSSGGDLLWDGALTKTGKLVAAGILDTNGFDLIGFAQIPEPSTGIALAVGSCLCLLRRRVSARK